MRMMDELKPLFLYSANKKVYAPIDEKDKRHNSAVLLLTPSLEESCKLTNLPYIYNPNLFASFYIDRNVMAYIDNVDLDKVELDEQEEEAVSEAMLRNWNHKVKFKFDDNVSIMDKKYVESVFENRTINELRTLLRITYLPETIKVFIYPNVSSLQDKAPSWAKSAYRDKLYSYSNDNEIHLVSKRVYDPEIMGGPYDIYLKNELICSLLIQANPDLSIIPVCAIAQVLSGLTDLKKENEDEYEEVGTEQCNKLAKSIKTIIDSKKMDIIYRYIRTGDINVFVKFTTSTVIGSIKKLIFESQISYFDRQNLLPSEFGVPDKRKYPIHDEEHVKIAIKMFNNCDPSDEKELAENIIKKINKYGIKDIKVGVANRFKPYYDAALEKEKNNNTKKEDKSPLDKLQDKIDSAKDSIKDKAKEKLKNVKDKTIDKLESILKKEASFLEGSFDNSDYADILRICDHLSKDEFRRVTFYDTYRNSKFVIKRIIRKESGIPVGFLDVYQFPSKPEIAQIVIAVDSNYRGRGIADSMVKELLSTDLPSTHGFNIYYWSANTDNTASQNLALKNGFTDTKHKDAYGRYVYINKVKDMDNISMKDIPEYLKPSINTDATITENAFVTSDMALISEADNAGYSQKLKKYLYRERIRNNKGVIVLYDKVKESNPKIKYTYIKLEMYKRRNIFVDLSYYHALFLKNNIYKLDKAVNFYFDFLNKLINNKDIDILYPKKTIFIPIDSGVWSTTDSNVLMDYRKSLNPISIIVRLVRTNPAALKKAWGDKDIIFVGSRGYFKIDFNKFEKSNLGRFKRNLTKLMSSTEIIEDEYEADELDDNSNEDNINMAKKNTNTTKAMTATMVDKIEQGYSIKVDNISTDNKTQKVEVIPHLQLSKDKVGVGNDPNNVAIINLDPDGPEGYERISKTILANVGKVSIYCMPK